MDSLDHASDGHSFLSSAPKRASRHFRKNYKASETISKPNLSSRSAEPLRTNHGLRGSHPRLIEPAWATLPLYVPHACGQNKWRRVAFDSVPLNEQFCVSLYSSPLPACDLSCSFISYKHPFPFNSLTAALHNWIDSNHDRQKQL